ncbi:MAG: glutaredoxin family protein [Leptolyngbyaceae cyanobacterium MO_188.B28]|nr:glutaredoxin family protein [Leptolyngbyaceae cyanobacterium MO_188.B28]
MQLILYSKPGCHLCEGLQEKLEQIEEGEFELEFELEIRDITTRPDWFQAYQYEIPVLCQVISTGDKIVEAPLPRLSPRSSVGQVERMLQKYLGQSEAK